MLTVKDGPGFYRGPIFPDGPPRRGCRDPYPSAAKGTNEEEGIRVKRRIRPRAAPVVRDEGLSSSDEVLRRNWPRIARVSGQSRATSSQIRRNKPKV